MIKFIFGRNKFTQKAKNAFCKKFANKSENSVSDLTKLLKKYAIKCKTNYPFFN